ncbi:MAG: photosynthesis system II assembly factor Ycf48 [Leptolyngbyaceae cyanobacterium RU_5_1]|nr:photosynthesis system II assembly factor Ycf48 [Leptolyngbyaceae cyanobacterium RU_5_1]
MRMVTNVLRKMLVLLAIALLCTGCGEYLPSVSSNPWQLVPVPTDENLLDISFVGDSAHGWLVGTKAGLFETNDGGSSWEQRSLDLDQPYRFTCVSFSDREGWIVGQPSILLHTEDEGRSWSRIPLSEKLPGAPNTILALSPNSAEMTTNVGAIYRTSDGGKTWKAMVEEAVGVIRNISRSPEGKYVAVSSRGSFYSTWEPGQTAWQPHNRNSSRRVQNMGFAADGRLWMLARGGQIQLSRFESPDDWEEPISPEMATSWGLLDLAYRTPDEVWVSGGSGNLLRSIDGGKTWEKDRFVEDVPSNLYNIKFFGSEKGFIIGQQGTLLKYESESESA